MSDVTFINYNDDFLPSQGLFTKGNLVYIFTNCIKNVSLPLISNRLIMIEKIKYLTTIFFIKMYYCLFLVIN